MKNRKSIIARDAPERALAVVRPGSPHLVRPRVAAETRRWTQGHSSSRSMHLQMSTPDVEPECAEELAKLWQNGTKIRSVPDVARHLPESLTMRPSACAYARAWPDQCRAALRLLRACDIG